MTIRVETSLTSVALLLESIAPLLAAASLQNRERNALNPFVTCRADLD
jgi:hypothetical protein